MSRRLFVLLAYDPAAGWAAAPVGALGADDDGQTAVSFIPYEPRADGWRDRIASCPGPLGQAVEDWEGAADGISWGLVEWDAPAGAADLRGAVEGLVDDLLHQEV